MKNGGGKKILLAVVIVVVAVVCCYVGFLIGTKQGKMQAQQEWEPIVNVAFPKPPEQLFYLNGTVVDVVGATISLEINDPDDYLPHTDGSPVATEVRYANLTGQTKVLAYDMNRVDANGNPLSTQIRSSDLKAGDSIMVKSDANIRDAEQFDVTEVALIRY
jgi:hypothetical protein